MVDLAKIADVVLLLIDGNFGFEMETMEFLNILSATGMPGNVFSVLTHLDLFKKPHHLKDAKKTLKHRLWNELYQGAHLFYLSGTSWPFYLITCHVTDRIQRCNQRQIS